MSLTAVARPGILDHSLSALRYRLIAGVVDLAPLRILAARSVSWKSWRVSFHILGASHAVVLDRDGKAITELLTCSAPPEVENIVGEGLAERVSSGSICVGDLSLRTNLERFPLGNNWTLPRRFHTKDSMHMDFSTISEGCALTAICWENFEEKLIVETVHTYPEEGMGIRSHSEFEVIDAAA
jgi:hypothetical protein